MNTGRKTNRSDIALHNGAVALSDEALDHVVGGCPTNENIPSPPPSRDPSLGEAKAGRAYTPAIG
jgi:hypothetical protein